MPRRLQRGYKDEGYDIRAIRPPTVPEGTSRLRLSLNADMDENLLYDFAAALEKEKALAA